MKNLFYLVLVVCFMAGNTSAEAQILKKLKKQVEKKVENTVVKNVSDKAADETDKSLDNLWEKKVNNSFGNIGMEMVDPSEIPATYTFDWEYVLKVKTSEGEMDMIYHITENAPYVGIEIPQAEDMFTVLDTENQMTVMYMNSEGNKMVMASRINASQEVGDNENPYEEMEFKEIGNKTILGYDCKGYKAENPDQTIEFYVTDEAGVSFRDLYHENQKNLPKGLDADWLKDGTGLMMEMTMTDKNKPQKNVSMFCTGVEKKPLQITTSDYQSINMGGR